MENDLLNTFTEAEGRSVAIRIVLESCIAAFVESSTVLLDKMETEMAHLPQYGGRRKQ